MRGLLITVTVICSFMIPLSAGAVDVLLLGDGGSEVEVQPALEAAGHTVTFAGIYGSWDGINPAAADFDVVVFLDGIAYSQSLQAGAATALSDAVASGHGLVMTEWIAWESCGGNEASEIADLMPVVMAVCWDYGANATWVVDDPSHPLTDGLPASWSDGAGWSTVGAKADSVVAVSDDTSNPMVSYWNPTGGIVVHINHDLLYTTASIDANAMQLIINAVDFADPLLFACGFEDGTTSAWATAGP